jgi:hypothetical protein
MMGGALVLSATVIGWWFSRVKLVGESVPEGEPPPRPDPSTWAKETEVVDSGGT